jgi:prophage regulatory protein
MKVETEVNHLRIIRKHEVMRVSGLRSTKIWEMEKKGEFPARIRLSERASGWIESEVHAWIERRIAASRGSTVTPGNTPTLINGRQPRRSKIAK